jgi:tetratricopeptide (TPR) repeat protein
MRSVCFLFLAPSLLAAAGQTPERTPSTNVDELLRGGITAQQHGDYKTAIEDYRKALAIDPKLAEAQSNLGAALAEVGDYDAAIEADTRAMASAPDKTAVRMNLALAYYKKGDMGNARAGFEAVHAARPNDTKTAVLLGYTYIKLDKGPGAAALLGPLELGQESNMDFEYVLGYALIESGREAEGTPRMERVAQATRSVDAYVLAGSARMQKSEFQQARADFDTALGIDPSFPGLNTMAGQARDAMGDTDASVPAFEAALRQDPKDATANLYLGVTRLKQRDFDKARPLLELALELRPGHSLTRFELAKLNGLTGRYTEAAATLEDLEKNDPKWIDPHIELAAIYYKLHRPEDGQREREIVQKLDAEQQKAGPHRD